MEILSQFTFIMVFILSLTGWGLAVRHWTGVAIPGGAVPVLGLAMLLLLGGSLVALGGVTPLILFALLLTGCLISLGSIYQRFAGEDSARRESPPKLCPQLLPYSGVLIAGIIAFWASCWSSAFHINDDLEKYLKYPLRLLETGGLKTGPFDALGTEALGGMSFLQSFALLFGPLEQVHAIDAVIGLILAMSCLVSVLRHLGMSGWWCVLSSLLIPMVDPLYVNISAAYTGVALMILAFAYPVFVAPADPFSGWRNAVVLGGLYAALVSLKTTFALFVPIHFIVLVLMCSLRKGAFLTTIWRSGKLPISACLLAAPWFLVHWEKGHRWAWQIFTSRTISGTELSANPSFPGWRPFAWDAPSLGFYSSNTLFSIFALWIIATTILEAIRGSWREMSERRLALISTGWTVSLVYWAGLHWMTYRMSGPDSALRYMMPLLIAGSLVIALSGTATRNPPLRLRPKRPQWAFYRWYACLAAWMINLAFLPSYLARTHQSLSLGHAIGIPSLATIDYTQWFQHQMSAEVAAQIRNAQQAVPAGAGLLVWIGSPIHLDYARNHILDVDLAGLTSPWVGFPFFENAEAQVDALVHLGVDYILWQYWNSPDRSIEFLRHREQQPYLRRHFAGRNGIAFVRALQALPFTTERVETFYDDGQLRILKING